MTIHNDKDNLLFLDHIVDALEKIIRFTKGHNRESLYEDEMAYAATIRQFEIIGEAANRLSNEFKEKHFQIPWIDAIDMRNILIHEYDNVNSAILWKTIQDDVPSMLAQIRELLKTIDK